MVRLPWGSSIEVDLSEAIGGEVFKQGVFDIGVSECAWRLLRRGDKVIDAGGNIGYMALLFAAKVGSAGAVDSFEPHPVLHDELRANVRRNDYRHVSEHASALGAAIGQVNLSESEYFLTNRGTATISEERPMAGTCRSHSVPMTTLDAVFPTESFTLLKVDVEGFEMKVLQGAQNLLRENRIEHIIYEDHTAGAGGIPELLATYGYHVFSIGHDLFGLQLRPVQERIALDTSWESVSYLATLSPDKVDKAVKPRGWGVLRNHI